MGGETRSEAIYRMIQEFIDDENSSEKNLILYSSEISKVRKHLAEKKVNIKVIAKELRRGLWKTTLKKM